jgi:hypothetical protein
MSEVAAGIVQGHLNMPYAQLVGQESREAWHWGDGLGPRMGAKSQCGKPHLFHHGQAVNKSILQGEHSKYTSLAVAKLMGAHEPPLQYTQTLQYELF